MLAIKIIGCVLVIASSTAMGFFFSNEMKCRVDHLKELKKLIVLLRGDIRYANTPLPEAISSIARKSPDIFKTFFQSTSQRLQELSGQTFAEIWKDAVNKELTETSLTKKDKQHLAGFGENLGYLDKDMQINTLDLYITQLEDEITETSKTVKEKAYLYNSLGIMAGIFISIVMF
ncbi:MAG TPA: stage III sporulation protein AB [Lachnospiraceae bacterium]|jgi:stage III sporulation protein AB|nr:stage III sporulation protein AB [Lachnospiraceae bacterium]HBY71891.1 stage III sporulation protein AB [Lachnospiraceae bacterium]HCM14107.1 stage III sporulation protein AB [Lachnospiraceae bacterium]HCR39530.1 stage III sporulation protein AB [Lachnospiraceae bacterium]